LYALEPAGEGYGRSGVHSVERVLDIQLTLEYVEFIGWPKGAGAVRTDGSDRFDLLYGGDVTREAIRGNSRAGKFPRLMILRLICNGFYPG
jgi:hypothetical protein